MKKIIVILGPTASGKSGLSLKLAEEYNGEIISADSRTVYREMDVGTAKPLSDKNNDNEVKRKNVEKNGINNLQNSSISDLFSEKPMLIKSILHWGFNLRFPNEEFSVADFKKYADKKIFEIIKRNHVPFLVGGTGLYIDAVVNNFIFNRIGSDEKLRDKLDELNQKELEERLKRLDVEAHKIIDVNNRRRLIRTIEIIELTGKPFSQQNKKGLPKYKVLKIGISRDRVELNERIDNRVDKMIANGLVDEVRQLKNKYGCEVNAMTGIGYRQICAFFSGYMKLNDAIEIIKRDTRHYAKRQMTWFKRDKNIHWVKDKYEADRLIKEFLKEEI